MHIGYFYENGRFIKSIPNGNHWPISFNNRTKCNNVIFHFQTLLSYIWCQTSFIFVECCGCAFSTGNPNIFFHFRSMRQSNIFQFPVRISLNAILMITLFAQQRQNDTSISSLFSDLCGFFTTRTCYIACIKLKHVRQKMKFLLVWLVVRARSCWDAAGFIASYNNNLFLVI